MSMTRRPSFRAALLLAALGLLAVPRGRAFADGEGGEGGEGQESLQQKIKAQMEKVLKLMRESEKALLDASRTGGKKPPAPEIPPPEGPSMEGAGMADPGMGSPEGGAPPGEGEKVRQELEELLKAARSTGGAVPGELEELVKMIPVQKGQGEGQGKPDPNPGESGSTNPRQGKEMPDAGDPNKPQGGKKPEDPAKRPEKDGGGKPPDGDKSDPAHPEVPPWYVGLPEEIRHMITTGDTEHVPPEYRDRVEAYLKWLSEHAKGGSGR